MRAMITALLLLVAGQAFASEQVISVQHDSQRRVTCWILNNTGISCLPDSSLLQVRESAPTDETQTARASMDSNTAEYDRFPTVSLPQGERLQI
ncbi:hypothetical protein QZH45_04705 [Pseudomonas corrugata]|uniref:hypothetical protein n=1 Tax=Pseudomonas corrugata TaxID=47879 RepID=UPI00083D003D|nr:hypothetical protein [Pseudomonas corrugata]